MRVTVKLIGVLRDQVGAPSFAVELSPGGTYRDVLDAVQETMRTKLEASSWDLDRRMFSRRMMVLLNGTRELRDETEALAEGDEIVVVLPLAGG